MACTILRQLIEALKIIDEQNVSLRVAGAAVGINQGSLHQFRCLRDQRPDLYERVLAGTLSLHKATRLRRESDYRPADELQRERTARMKAALDAGHLFSDICKQEKIGRTHGRRLLERAGIDLSKLESLRNVRGVNTRRIVEETVNGLVGYAIGIDSADTLGPFTAEEADTLLRLLAPALRSIRRVERILRLAARNPRGIGNEESSQRHPADEQD